MFTTLHWRTGPFNGVSLDIIASDGLVRLTNQPSFGHFQIINQISTKNAKKKIYISQKKAKSLLS